MAVASFLDNRPTKVLKLAVNSLFVVMVLGQLIFALYILGLYGINGMAGDFEKWSTAGSHGYVQQDTMGNILFGMHVLLAFIVTIGGPLQLMKKVRNRFPKFHRINGRIYIVAAVLISMAGFYLTWVRGTVGDLAGHIFISTNGAIILVCAWYTIKHAMAHKFEIHRKWAIRLFLAMSGVWFFRVFLMLWLAIHQAPVGFDMDSFSGPALNMIYTFSHIMPIVFAEFYFGAKASNRSTNKWAMSAFFFILICCILIGTFTATMGMWLPSI